MLTKYTIELTFTGTLCQLKTTLWRSQMLFVSMHFYIIYSYILFSIFLKLTLARYLYIWLNTFSTLLNKTFLDFCMYSLHINLSHISTKSLKVLQFACFSVINLIKIEYML